MISIYIQTFTTFIRAYCFTTPLLVKHYALQSPHEGIMVSSPSIAEGLFLF